MNKDGISSFPNSLSSRFKNRPFCGITPIPPNALLFPLKTFFNSNLINKNLISFWCGEVWATNVKLGYLE